MSSQYHNHSPSLVPGPQSSVHRVDSQQDFKQALDNEPLTCVAYRPEFAPHLERARKNRHRNHRIVDAYIYAQSYAERGVEVPDVLFDGAPAPYQAVRQPSHRAHLGTSSQGAPVDAVSQSQRPHRARPDASRQQLVVPVRAPTNIQSDPPSSIQRSRIPQPPSHAPRTPHHHLYPSPPPAPSPTSSTTIPTPSPPHVPALVHILSLLSFSPGHYIEIEGERIYKSPSRHDSLTSNGFIAGGQLDSNVAAHLLEHVENPRTKLELLKQQGRKQWHKMV